jgi:CubicO group peptidase (beta-lactamase class C family)
MCRSLEVISDMRILSWKRAAWLTATLLAVIVLACMAVFTRWFMVAGPQGGYDATLRFIRHGVTKIDDFKHYPARFLTAGQPPYRFAERVNDWRTPEVVDIGADERKGLEDVLSASQTVAFLIVKDDTILLERYDGGYAADSPSQYFSVSKSITSVLIGAAIDDGLIGSIDQRVVDFVPEFVGRGFERLTIGHLITMTSGIDYVENDNPFGLHVPFNYTSDIERMMLDFRMRGEPGTEYRYKSGDTALLSLILKRALAPTSITAYAQERLWSPLGMEHDGVWSLDRDDGLEKVWCCLAGTARDLAKIGRLYLARGEWDGKRIVSAEWIERSVLSGAVDEPVWPENFRAAGFWSYGYSWWLLSKDEGDYLAQGKGGQFLYVNPTRRTIIVRLGRSTGYLRTSQWVSMFRFLARETN